MTKSQRPTLAPIVLAILALVAYLFFLASDYKRCQQTICRSGLQPTYLARDLRCLCVGEKEK